MIDIYSDSITVLYERINISSSRIEEQFLVDINDIDIM